MEAGRSSGLDVLEGIGERWRSHLGVDTLTVSRLSRGRRDLGVLINAGVLGPGELRQPADERYGLAAFPAAAALITHRRPYLFGSGISADPASARLELVLEKTSQAAAPLIVGDEVWGELWVASTADGLPLQAPELSLICWAAGRLGTEIATILGDGVDLDVARLTPEAEHYEVWIEGHINATFAALIPAAARRRARYTIFEASVGQADLYRLLSRLVELSLPIVAVRAGSPSGTPPYHPGTPSGRRSHVYVIRVAGQLDIEALRVSTSCSVAHRAGDSLVTATLDQAELAGVLRRLERLEARLLSLHRKR